MNLYWPNQSLTIPSKTPLILFTLQHSSSSSLMHPTRRSFKLPLTTRRQAHIPDDTAEHAGTELRDLLHNILREAICSILK